MNFDEWSAMYNKPYRSIEDYDHRKAIFDARVAEIEQFNAEGHSYKMGLNSFSDLTEAEIDKYMKMAPVAVEEPVAMEMNARDLPEVDWRKHNAVTSVKDQGNCGSCWAFSAAAVLESAYAQTYGQLIDFSTQQLVDCSGSYGNNACNGGMPYKALKYTQVYGIESWTSYPYTAKKGTCVYDASKVITKNSQGYADVKGESNLQAKLKSETVSVCFYSKSSMSSYKSGVYYDASCPTNSINHAVHAVGMGHDAASGMDFYIIKNSWGTSWGEEGYVRFAANKNNMCAISNYGVVPKGMTN